MNKSEISSSRWLEAHSDRTADIVTLPHNAVLSDVVGDGNYRLVITELKIQEDRRSKLKIYKDVSSSDIILPGIPNSLITFYTNQLSPYIPAVAVTCGPYLYVYKNNKPFYKFRLPTLPVLAAENDFWKMCNEGKETSPDIKTALDKLKSLPLNSLSDRAQRLISASSTKYNELIKEYMRFSPTKETTITCTSTLKKSSQDRYAVSCPVIGTESGHIYILEPQTLTILHQANVCSKRATPFVIATTGLFDVEYRIIIACREKHICILRRGWLEGKLIIQLTNNIIDIVIIPGDLLLVVATDDNKLNCYTKRGQNLWFIEIKTRVTCLCLVPLHHLSVNLVAVGMMGGLIYLYNGRHLVDYTYVPDTPSVIVFGQLGQEENVMVVITLGGTITFKILKRTADFKVYVKENFHVLQSTPLPLPKRSKLFLEQHSRERSSFVGIHQRFQEDVVILRLRSSTELMNNVNKQIVMENENDQINLSAEVFGMGTTFSIILNIKNMHSQRWLKDLNVMFHIQPSACNISSNIVKVPLVPPNTSYKINIQVEESVKETNQDEGNLSLPLHKIPHSILKVYLTKNRQIQHIFSAKVNMISMEHVNI